MEMRHLHRLNRNGTFKVLHDLIRRVESLTRHKTIRAAILQQNVTSVTFCQSEH